MAGLTAEGRTRAWVPIEVKSLESPDETRPFADKGQAEVVNIGGGTVLRGTFEPGWRWYEHVKPIAQTDSCQNPHFLYALSGRMGVAWMTGRRLARAMLLGSSLVTTLG